VVARRGSIIFVYIGEGQCHHFNLDIVNAAAMELVERESSALVEGQEVES
jgi:hypothetical protein